jgi:D-amino-acid dehydrogenase
MQVFAGGVGRMQGSRQQTVVIGAGVIGCAVAYRLAAAGRTVLLLDRDEPGRAGASYGNAGRIAVELVEPIPNVGLLFNFWRDTFALGGVFDLPLARLPRFAPWALQFARAAFRKQRNTELLTPLVRSAAQRWHALLAEIGATRLLVGGGHYHFWLNGDVAGKAGENAQAFARLGVPSEPAPAQVLGELRDMARRESVAGLWFPDSAHVVDPMLVCRALADAAVARGARFQRAEVSALERAADGATRILAGGRTIDAEEVVVCAGPPSTAMLAPFGVHAPLEAARGYHIELPGRVDRFGLSVIFVDNHLAMTPMAGRIRVSSYLDFVDHDAPPDPRKVDRLLRNVRDIGFDTTGAVDWFGSRSALPDSLPGIGRAPGPQRVFYAVGGQMIGLTIAAGVADMVRDLVVAGHSPAAAPFDLVRYSSRSQSSH